MVTDIVEPLLLAIYLFMSWLIEILLLCTNEKSAVLQQDNREHVIYKVELN